MNVELEKTRIYNLRLYMFEILNEILNSENYQINANFLSNDINNYSLDKLPLNSIVRSFIGGDGIYRDVYNFRCRQIYGADVLDNLSSIGFFETFENLIEIKNKQKVLPLIEGIQKIKCLNCGAISIARTDKAEFTVQIEIQYYKEVKK